MVGAGFSFNATPSVSSARPFPTWAHLTKALAETLYPEQGQADKAVTSSEALRLAQEFEAVYGRFRLEEFIRRTIPDAEYGPGELHKRLLSLPWADVFTTNWDTLLERGSLDVHERLYDAVLTQSQIPSASVPRIVKLHGSLPAHTPFIVTEEDYRSYPSRFAPFVNLVQQSMMENAFVLLGFSGDDPNFLSWSGWVRDNLGAHAPKIFLVSWLGLSSQRRRMLEDRNVVPLDLADLPQASKWPTSMRYRFATEWFITAMEAGRPARASAWPRRIGEKASIVSYLGWVPQRMSSDTVEEPFPKSGLSASMQDRIVDLTAVSTAWSTNRRCYPNWFIAPTEVRDRLWNLTLYWLPGICLVLNEMKVRTRLLVCRELIWRLETCLIGAEQIMDLPATLQQTVLLVDIQKRTTQLPDQEPEDLSEAEMDGVRSALFALARIARRTGDEDSFANASSSLTIACSGKPDLEEEVRFERMLWLADRLDYDPLEKTLDVWDVDLLDPVWGMRKAALLARVARVNEARFALRAALARVRRERRRDVDDYASFSREAWGLWLTLALRDNLNRDRPDDLDPFERWRALSFYDCDALGEYRNLVSEMLEPPPPEEVSRHRGFDLGTVSIRTTSSSGLPGPYKAATQMVRLSELTCLPLSANNVSLLRDGLTKAAEILVSDWPLRSILLAIDGASTGDDSTLGVVLRRARIAVLSVSEFNQLNSLSNRLFEASLPRSRLPDPRHQYWHTRLRVSIEVISRLVLRASTDEALGTLERAKRLYSLGWPIEDGWLATEIVNLFRRTLESLSDNVLIDETIKLLDLPVPGTAVFVENGAFQTWQDPFEVLGPILVFRRRSRDLRFHVKPSSDVVSRLFNAARESTRARHFAAARLLVLQDFGLLNSSDNDLLGSLLWSEDDQQAKTFPKDVSIHPWAFLFLPEQVVGLANTTFWHTLIHEHPGHYSVSDVLWNVGCAMSQSRKAPSSFELTDENFRTVTKLIEDWTEKTARVPSLFGAALERRNDTSTIYGISLIITERELEGMVAEKVWQKVALLEQSDPLPSSPFILYIGLLRAFPQRLPELTQRLRQGLVSANSERACDAIAGLYRWLDGAQNFSWAPCVPIDLIAEVGTIIAARRRGVVEQALELAIWIFKEGNTESRASLSERCDLGLSYLLTEASYESELKATASETLDVALLRRNSVRLALAMKNAGFTHLSGVSGWIDAAAKDTLPEVRNLV